MTPRQISSIVSVYKAQLELQGVIAKRIDMDKTFGSLENEELEAHALYLCNNMENILDGMNPEEDAQRKAGSHLTAIQMCLSFADWYTLGEMRLHNFNGFDPISRPNQLT